MYINKLLPWKYFVFWVLDLNSLSQTIISFATKMPKVDDMINRSLSNMKKFLFIVVKKGIEIIYLILLYYALNDL